MRRNSILVILLLGCLPALTMAASVTDFEGGAKEAVAGLASPGFEAKVNFEVPAECHVSSAFVNISSQPPDDSFPGYPEDVSVLLEDEVIWAFNGADYGALGSQNGFLNGKALEKLKTVAGSGEDTTHFRIPKDAEVQKAALDLECEGAGPGELRELLNWTGYVNENLGNSTSGAGDVNMDGYDDFIVGVESNDTGGKDAGVVYLYLGGASLDAIPDLTLVGDAAGDHFGRSVSGVGDLNKDGYDDIIVGALWSDAQGTDSGAAYLYLGGASLDAEPDLVLAGGAAGDYFGCSVSGAGDVNNDGYDDLIVGANGNDSWGISVGTAYVFCGGASLDSKPNLVLVGGYTGDGFGTNVSGAGDVNKDGYDDFIVGAPSNDTAGENAGAAYIFLGGESLDTEHDLVLFGSAVRDHFGYSVSGAGDVNKDGYDDFIVGAPFNDTGGIASGAAYVYLGGASLDTTPDLVLFGGANEDSLGFSVSGAGDVNKDGCDDFIVGARKNDTKASWAGAVHLHLGGASLNIEPDLVLVGGTEADFFGHSVSDAGDVNKDGYDDFIVAAPGGRAPNTGKASLFGFAASGLLDPAIGIGSTDIWSETGYVDGTNDSGDFAPALMSYLGSAIPSGSDAFDNRYVDVPITVRATNQGNITLSGLNITYDCTATSKDFGSGLNDYILAHKGEKDLSGNIRVPITIKSESGGRVKLSGLNIVFDANRPPRFTSTPVTTATVGVEYVYDADAMDPDNDTLVFALDTNLPGMTIDPASGMIRWTPTAGGNFSIVVMVTDGTVNSTQTFTIVVGQTNRPPRFTSTPVTAATVGVEYVYDADAVDNDNDTLSFSLGTNVPGMRIDPGSGRISWTPSPNQTGAFNIVLKVSDGKSETRQDFVITVSSTSKPLVTVTNPTADQKLGGLATITGTAIRGTFDIIRVEIRIDGGDWRAASGSGSWSFGLDTSGLSNGRHTLEARAYDGREFSATVTVQFVVDNGVSIKPQVTVVSPIAGQKLSGNATITGTAIKGTRDLVKVEVRIDGGGWKVASGLDPWSFVLDTSNLTNGKHTLEAKASDIVDESPIVTVSFEVYNAAPATPAAAAESNPWSLAVMAAVVALVAVVGLAALYKMKRGKGKGSATPTQTPAPPPPPQQQVPPPPQPPQGPSPPA